jgi:general secretion pathway protein A
MWLTTQLNQLYNLPKTNKDRFDWKLKEQIMQFQGDHNLIADGIVGQQTLMPLMQQLDTKIPRLLSLD